MTIKNILAILVVAGCGTLAATAQMTHDVGVGPGFAFVPADIVIETGDAVRWTWVSGFHNVVSGAGGVADGNFSSGSATSVVGTVFEVTFDQAFLDAHPMTDNVYPYFCEIHAGLGMIGTVRVVCPADISGDGSVDIRDLATLLANYGSAEVSYFDGDLDFDGDVDLADLAKLLGLYGTVCE